MKFHHLLAANAIGATMFGFAFALVPASMLALYGVRELPTVGVTLFMMLFFTRLLGVSLICFGALLWALRDCEGAQDERRIAAVLLAVHAVGALVAAVESIDIWNTTAGNITVLLFSLFAAGYGYFTVNRRRNKQRLA